MALRRRSMWAVDPLEGTRLTALGMPSAIAVIALAERGAMSLRAQSVYMEKIAGGPEIADLLDLDRPLGETLGLIAERKQVDIRDVMVVMLDRDRHHAAMLRGARSRSAREADLGRRRLGRSCWRSARNSPVDLLGGIGGTPEGVISAAAIKCTGGELLGRLWPRDDVGARGGGGRWLRPKRVLTCDDLVAGEDVFFSASGVTDGDVLQGVRYQGRGATTESLVMRSRSGTVRRVARPPRPQQAAHAQRRALWLSGRVGWLGGVGRGCGVGCRAASGASAASGVARSASDFTFDSARSSFASERRNACVTSDVDDPLCDHGRRECCSPAAIDGLEVRYLDLDPEFETSPEIRCFTRRAPRTRSRDPRALPAIRHGSASGRCRDRPRAGTPDCRSEAASTAVRPRPPRALDGRR